MQVSAVVSALKAAVGSSWQDAEWDGLQAGSLDAEVTGVAVAWSPSTEVMKKAVDAGCKPADYQGPAVLVGRRAASSHGPGLVEPVGGNSRGLKIEGIEIRM